ncbi:MarR family winged helix-turn-helix transcriptional regulator [Hansschlegelia beijingensis]|uniref:DNA-binding MarR family transcriptional regulator n=1 Tax=Hansschlegelia beijingensis TaxID=1133344 RepID=A0A7W6CYZ2_9HYPH|nr:MarR family transcriptional regulator [Hansschlegelia beijingensis]MBB3973626.1 DNA-binding MarR family transcriptional regulator [Hansschlegelia beijingensis]
MIEKAAESEAAKEDWPLLERPGFLARRLHQIHVSLFAERCAEFRITPLQYSLLSALSELGEADQTRLARAVAIDRTTTTGALKRLEVRGLLRRVTSDRDRRSQACRMTPAGAALLAAMEAAARSAHEATVEPLNPEEQATLIGLMKRAVAAHEDRLVSGMPST